MKLQSLLAPLLSLLAIAAAAPTSSSSFGEPAPFSFIGASFIADKTDALSKRNIGGVRLADGIDFSGHVWYGIYPLNQCINLGPYAGNVLSFRPDEGTECLLMQGTCDANQEYADLFNVDEHLNDLSYYEFYEDLQSYMCYTVVAT